MHADNFTSFIYGKRELHCICESNDFYYSKTFQIKVIPFLAPFSSRSYDDDDDGETEKSRKVLVFKKQFACTYTYMRMKGEEEFISLPHIFGK